MGVMLPGSVGLSHILTHYYSIHYKSTKAADLGAIDSLG